MDREMNKIVIVTRRTRLEELKSRFNTAEQARFYIEHLGADFSDYEREDRNYRSSLAAVYQAAEREARVQVIERTYLPNMIFGEQDVVIAVGQDGLVANTMKYLSGQPLIGVNPDAQRWDGILLPFAPGDREKLLPAVLCGRYQEKSVTMGAARTRDGQELYAVNDFFNGVQNHSSARYRICYNGITENHSSSGIIVSTGLGMTGWHRSVMAEFRGMARAFRLGEIREPAYSWDSPALVFQVREPYPSRFTQAELVYGEVTAEERLRIVSNMPEGGVIFSDGVPEDSIAFGAGMEVTVAPAERTGRLVTG